MDVGLKFSEKQLYDRVMFHFACDDGTLDDEAVNSAKNAFCTMDWYMYSRYEARVQSCVRP